jgi:DNA-binding transcriptional ArsR family regulator
LFDGPKTVGQLVKKVKQSQPAVSQHLKTLKLSNIVVDRREGQTIYYSLNSEHVLKLLKSLVKEVSKKK